ncbi:zinc transporter 5 isoform X4 [Drosophila biarmipes]|uniref:zinc transporter 5 isoform X4 n=1 Tax=Drosophila biarmipes TaxID=125945 RepID=UPI0021CD0AC1|nr:zinc transporter 5 isoform X4 [Drosophila biarmipes]
MPKYQKLDSPIPPTVHEDDCEGDFPLYSIGSHQVARLSKSRYQYHNLVNNGIESGVVTIETNTVRIPEEQTWEVPLLGDSDDRASQHGRMELNTELKCHSRQPGFGCNVNMKAEQQAKNKILLVAFICFIFMVIEFLGGYVAGSLAIMTDAAHLASDCISFVIGLVSIWVGGRPPDDCMSFGYKRFDFQNLKSYFLKYFFVLFGLSEVIGALASILGIWFLTTLLVVLAVQRICSQDFELDVNTMMVISGIGIAINIVMMLILHGSWFVSGNGHGHSHGNGHFHSHGKSFIKKEDLKAADTVPSKENIGAMDATNLLHRPGSECRERVMKKISKVATGPRSGKRKRSSRHDTCCWGSGAKHWCFFGCCPNQILRELLLYILQYFLERYAK